MPALKAQWSSYLVFLRYVVYFNGGGTVILPNCRIPIHVLFFAE